VVNNLVGYAQTTGQILIQSDGTPWRPLVHVQDISNALLAVLHAPRELVHDQAFNVGSSAENYRIRDIATIVEQIIPGARASFAEGGGPDKRSYQVDCSKITRVLGFQHPVDRPSGRRGALRRLHPQPHHLRRVHRHPLPAHQPRPRAPTGRPPRRRPPLAHTGRRRRLTPARGGRDC
jgi:nucleoside-diphosphate-sugar epimerase